MTYVYIMDMTFSRRCRAALKSGHRIAGQRIGGYRDMPDPKASVYLVSCVSKKRTNPSPARDLYISDWFLKARDYVESTHSPWFILSAEYGLVSPDQVLAPYERTLNTMSKAERNAWAT